MHLRKYLQIKLSSLRINTKKKLNLLTGNPWQSSLSSRVWSELREQELRLQRAALGQPEARPLSRDAELCRDPEPADPEEEPGLSRPGLWKRLCSKMRHLKLAH